MVDPVPVAGSWEEALSSLWRVKRGAWWLLLTRRKQRIQEVVTEAKVETLPVRVVRYNVSMLRLGQTLIPLALLCTVVARHIPGPVTAVASIGLSVTCLGLFALARRGLGRRILQIVGGKLAFAGAELEISPAAVAHWTLSERTARLYGPKASWKLTVARGDVEVLRDSLRHAFGKPLSVHRRGSLRARKVALSVAIVGAFLVVLAFYFDLLPLALLGTPCAVLGLATLGALSQKVSGATIRD
jgi:hypothetical protein